jgi:hypothetical protein
VVPKPIKNYADCKVYEANNDTLTYIQFMHGMTKDEINDAKERSDVDLSIKGAVEGDKPAPEKKLIFLKSDILLPNVARFRYFEMEVLENEYNANIYLGLIGEGEDFSDTPDNHEQIGGPDKIIIDGTNGSLKVGDNPVRNEMNLQFKEMGEGIGICFHYQNAKDQAEDWADTQIRNAQPGQKPGKKEDLMKKYKTQNNPKEQTRLLFFKDGVCVSSPDQTD